jgi:hypothetical protein
MAREYVTGCTRPLTSNFWAGGCIGKAVALAVVPAYVLFL